MALRASPATVPGDGWMGGGVEGWMGDNPKETKKVEKQDGVR